MNPAKNKPNQESVVVCRNRSKSKKKYILFSSSQRTSTIISRIKKSNKKGPCKNRLNGLDSSRIGQKKKTSRKF